MTDQRIKLAEFCDQCHEYVTDEPIWAQPEDGAACNNCGCGPHPDFDPRTDANDDYAVLEQMRHKCGRKGKPENIDLKQANLWAKFINHLHERECYEKGDYARAAWKVIEQQENDA